MFLYVFFIWLFYNDFISFMSTTHIICSVFLHHFLLNYWSRLCFVHCTQSTRFTQSYEPCPHPGIRYMLHPQLFSGSPAPTARSPFTTITATPQPSPSSTSAQVPNLRPSRRCHSWQCAASNSYTQ